MKFRNIFHLKLFKAGIATLLWLCTTGAIISFDSNDDEKSCLAHIEVVQDEQTTQFRGVLKNTGQQPIVADYSMETIKEGSSGRSSSRQSGPANAKAGEEVLLSTTQINIAQGDQYTIILNIFSANQLLCSDTLVEGNYDVDLNKTKNR